MALIVLIQNVVMLRKCHQRYIGVMNAVFLYMKMNARFVAKKGKYIATDIRPVFPEENILISLLTTGDPYKYQKSSIWYGSNSYIIDGQKIKLSVSKENSKPIEEIKAVKEAYEKAVEKIDYDSLSNI
ncbi:hypothetical protein [Butyrivibrio sp. LB2008]|uniref:hypothetical protein n=1 Tax=Butyrivibrio sp. LB2008 TaxID=1408305 RepID=UPI00047EACC3|nr:hypothetical protein [Butyrivibrio sp. LB2008]